MDRSVIRQLALEAPRISLQVGAFVKVGNHEHLQELRSDGLMYCNHIDYFRPIEGANLCDMLRVGVGFGRRFLELLLNTVFCVFSTLVFPSVCSNFSYDRAKLERIGILHVATSIG